MPEAQYRAGRASILRSFSERDAIYQTEVFHVAFENSARKNLQVKIAELET